MQERFYERGSCVQKNCAILGVHPSLRQKLPQWRSALGVTSIVITFLSWFGTAILLSLGSLSDNWEWPLALLALAGTILGFALRGASRMEAIAAGFLMFAGLTFTVS